MANRRRQSEPLNGIEVSTKTEDKRRKEDDICSVNSLSWDNYDLSWPNKLPKPSSCRHQHDVIVPTHQVDSLQSITSLQSVDSRHSASTSGRRSSSGNLTTSVSMRSFTDDKKSSISNTTAEERPPCGSFSGYVPSSSGSEQLEYPDVVVDRHNETSLPVSSAEQIQSVSQGTGEIRLWRSDKKQNAAVERNRRRQSTNPADAVERNRKDRRLLVVEVDDEEDGDFQTGRRRHDESLGRGRITHANDVDSHTESTNPVTSPWQDCDGKLPVHGSTMSSVCRPKSAVDFRLCISNETRSSDGDVDVSSRSMVFTSTSSVYVRSSSLVDLSSGSSEPVLTFESPKALRLAKGFFDSVCAAYSSKSLDNEIKFPATGRQTMQRSSAALRHRQAGNDAVSSGSDCARHSQFGLGGRRARRCADFQSACDQQLTVDFTGIRNSRAPSADRSASSGSMGNECVKIGTSRHVFVDNSSDQRASSDGDTGSDRDCSFCWSTAAEEGNAGEVEIEAASAAAAEKMIMVMTPDTKAVTDEMKYTMAEHTENVDGNNLPDYEGAFYSRDNCDDWNDDDDEDDGRVDVLSDDDVIINEEDDRNEARETTIMIAAFEAVRTMEDEKTAVERPTNSFYHVSKHDPQHSIFVLPNDNESSSTSTDKEVSSSLPVDIEAPSCGKDDCSPVAGTIDVETNHVADATDAPGIVFEVGSKKLDRSSTVRRINVGEEINECGTSTKQTAKKCKTIARQLRRDVSVSSPASVNCVMSCAGPSTDDVITATKGSDKNRVITTRKTASNEHLSPFDTPEMQSTEDDIIVIGSEEDVKHGGAVYMLKSYEVDETSRARMKSRDVIDRSPERCPTEATVAIADKSRTATKRIDGIDDKTGSGTVDLDRARHRCQEHVTDVSNMSEQGKNQQNSRVLISGVEKLTNFNTKFSMSSKTAAAAASVRSIPPNEPEVVEMCMSAVISGKLASAQTNMGKGDIVPDYKKLERVVRQTSSTVEGRMESHLIRGKQETEATAAAQCEIEEIQSDVKRSSHLPNNLCGAPTESNTKTKTCLHRSKTSAEIDEVALETVLTSASCRSRSSMSQPPAEMSLSLGAGQLDADVDADAALCVSVNDDEKKRKPVASMTLKNLLPMQDVITDTQKQVFSGKQPRLIRFFPSNNQSKTVTSPIMATDERLKSMTSSTEETFCASTVSDGNMTSADKRSLAPLTAAGSRQDSNSEQSRRDEDKSRVPGVSDFPGVRCRPSRIPRPVRRRMETMSRSRESSAERKRKSDAVVDVGMSNYLRHVTVGNDGSAMNSATKTADITPVSGESQDGSKSVVSVSATVSTTIRGSKFHDLLEYRRFARRSMEARWKALWRRARVMRWRRPRGDWRWQTEAEYGNMAEDEQQMTAYEKLDGPSTNSTGTLKQSPSELFSTTLDAERVAPKSDCAAPDHPPKEAQSTSHSSNATAAEVAVDPGIVAEAMKRIASSDAGARSKKSDCQLRRANNRCATTETGSINRTGVVSFSQIFASDVEGATNNSAITFDESTAAAEKLFPASNAGLSTSNNRTDVSDLQAEGKIGSHIGLIEDKKRNIERLLPKDSTDYVSKRTASSPAVVDQHLAHRTTSDDDVEYDRRWSTGNVQQQQQQQQQFIADNSMMRSNDDKRPERNLSQVDSKTEEVSHNQIETSVGEQCFWQSDDQLCTVINRTKHVVGLTRMSVETTRQDVTEQRRSEQVRLFKNRHKLGNGVGGMAVKPRNSIRVVTTCVRSRNRRSYTRLKYGRKRKSAEQSERCRLKVNFSDECHHCGQPRAEAANHDVIHHSSYGIEDAFYLKMGIISFLSNMRCCDGMRSRYVIRSCCSVAESSCKSATAVTAPVAATDDFSSVSAAQTASTKMLDMSQRLPCSPRACVETPVSQSCASSGNCFRCDDDKDRDRIRSHHVGASVTQVVTRNRRSPTSSVSDRCSRTVDGGTEWTRHMKSRFVHFNSAAGVLSEERLNRSCEQIATCEDVVAGITNNVSHDEQQCKCGMFSDRDSCNKIFLTDSPRFTCGQFNRSSAIDCLKNNSWSLSKEDAETPGGEHVETSKQLQSVVVGHCRFAGRRSSKIQQKLHYYPDIGTSVSGQRRPNELVSELGCAVGCLPMPGSEKATDIRRHLGASRRLLTDGIMSLTGSAAVVSDRS